MGRVGTFLKQSGANGQDLLARDKLAHSLMYLTRGQPVIYYGDEQGFTGPGGDKDARQDMFATKTADYADDEVVDGTGTTTIGSKDPFNTNAPMYKHIAALQKLRAQVPGSGGRHPGPPVLVEHQRPVRVQPVRRGQDRVPGRRQQRDDRGDRRPSRRTGRQPSSSRSMAVLRSRSRPTAKAAPSLTQAPLSVTVYQAAIEGAASLQGTRCLHELAGAGRELSAVAQRSPPPSRRTPRSQ